MIKIQNPHDKFFKGTFGHIKVVQDFLHHYLPVSLKKVVDISSLEPQKDSFINEDLAESFSDLLFKTYIKGQEGYFYFLFEHKSFPSKSIVTQLLKYMIEIWETKMNKEHKWELPIVIPLVVYQGGDDWNAVKSLGDMIKGYHILPEDLQVYVPNYKYLLYDLSNYSDEEVKGGAQLRIYLTICRDILTEDTEEFLASIFKALDYLLEIDEEETRIVYLEVLMRYIFSAANTLTENEVEKVMKRIETNYPEGRNVIMTLAERYMEKGKAEGRAAGKAEVAIKLMEKGFSVEEVVELTGIGEKEIKNIRKQMLQ